MAHQIPTIPSMVLLIPATQGSTHHLYSTIGRQSYASFTHILSHRPHNQSHEVDATTNTLIVLSNILILDTQLSHHKLLAMYLINGATQFFRLTPKYAFAICGRKFLTLFYPPATRIASTLIDDQSPSV
jgi:hypothetical protein